VDDGSTDKTYEVLLSVFSGNSKVKIFKKDNAGKAVALNYAIERSRGEIIIALDADTIFNPQTIEKLVRHFIDQRVGAVAGNAKVGNRVNISFSNAESSPAKFDRRAFALSASPWFRDRSAPGAGCIKVVVFRLALTEGADLTLPLTVWDMVVYEEKSLACRSTDTA
jgi:cellulose synthase/poly-beta-1,6-N-acetylglucosamine synthase-like glycosyltransferase